MIDSPRSRVFFTFFLAWGESFAHISARLQPPHWPAPQVQEDLLVRMREGPFVLLGHSRPLERMASLSCNGQACLGFSHTVCSVPCKQTCKAVVTALQMKVQMCPQTSPVTTALLCPKPHTNFDARSTEDVASSVLKMLASLCSDLAWALGELSLFSHERLWLWDGHELHPSS